MVFRHVHMKQAKSNISLGYTKGKKSIRIVVKGEVAEQFGGNSFDVLIGENDDAGTLLLVKSARPANPRKNGDAISELIGSDVCELPIGESEVMSANYVVANDGVLITLP